MSLWPRGSGLGSLLGVGQKLVGLWWLSGSLELAPIAHALLLFVGSVFKTWQAADRGDRGGLTHPLSPVSPTQKGSDSPQLMNSIFAGERNDANKCQRGLNAEVPSRHEPREDFYVDSVTVCN